MFWCMCILLDLLINYLSYISPLMNWNSFEGYPSIIGRCILLSKQSALGKLKILFFKTQIVYKSLLHGTICICNLLLILVRVMSKYDLSICLLNRFFIVIKLYITIVNISTMWLHKSLAYLFHTANNGIVKPFPPSLLNHSLFFNDRQFNFGPLYSSDVYVENFMNGYNEKVLGFSISSSKTIWMNKYNPYPLSLFSEMKTQQKLGRLQ